MFINTKFNSGDIVERTNHSTHGPLTITAVDVVYTVVDSEGVDDTVLEDEIAMLKKKCIHTTGHYPNGPASSFEPYKHCPDCGEKLPESRYIYDK